jgi:hypothetical protein
VNTATDRLYELLPAIHRIRDAEQGYPLRELLAVIAGQVAAMEENLEQLYDDQFIETCAPWVAPYIGDLIGYRSLHGVVPNVASPRADVANTIRYRRRKGTASMLEQMAHDVTGWPARAVEFFQLLGWTQNMNHLRTQTHYAPDLRNWEKLHWRDTAFDTIAHTVDVRHISTVAARHNIPNIGITLWRVREFPLSRSPAVADPNPALNPVINNAQYFRFNPLGTDMELYNKPETEAEISHLAEPRNVPIPLARRWLKAHLDDYYGQDKSLWLELDGNPPQLIPRNILRICDLSDIKDGGGNVIAWAHKPAAGSGLVSIDPVLGRIAFADVPAAAPLVSFHYGFTIAIGGGEYERGDPDSEPDQTVQGGAVLQPKLNLVQNGGTVAVLDSGRYVETPSITVNAGKTVVLRAVNGARPLLAASGDIVLTLDAEATLILDGWVISGGTLIMAGFADTLPRYLVLRDCTLVPGPRSKGDGSTPQADDPGLVVNHPFASVKMERCISAPLHIVAGAEVSLNGCVVDASAQSLIAFRGPGAGALAPGGALTLESCTVIGKVHTRQLTLASDCLFVAALTAGGDAWKAPLWAERRQQGCVRFSWVPPNSRTPRRYHCQPEEGDQETRPHFTSLRYGDPGYCQLRQSTSDKIRRGAHDESEMGVLHDLYQPQREINLRVRLEEYLRFGLEAGLIYGS